MKCNEIRELMPDLAAGLSAADPEMNKHLESCMECLQSMQEFRQTMALLDEWQTPEPSPYFDTRLHARLREEMAAQPSGWMQWIRRPALACGLALAMLVGITVYQERGNIWQHGNGQVASAVPVAPAAIEPGTAVGDLQALDKNNELYSDYEVLDDLQVQQDVTANP